jgi:hypothetical protein
LGTRIFFFGFLALVALAAPSVTFSDAVAFPSAVALVPSAGGVADDALAASLSADTFRAASSSSTSISSSTVYVSSTDASARTRVVIPEVPSSNCSDTLGLVRFFSSISLANSATPVMLYRSSARLVPFGRGSSST